MQTWHKKGNLSPRKATNMRSTPLELKRKTKKDVNVSANSDDLKNLDS